MNEVDVAALVTYFASEHPPGSGAHLAGDAVRRGDADPRETLRAPPTVRPPAPIPAGFAAALDTVLAA